MTQQRREHVFEERVTVEVKGEVGNEALRQQEFPGLMRCGEMAK